MAPAAAGRVGSPVLGVDEAVDAFAAGCDVLPVLAVVAAALAGSSAALAGSAAAGADRKIFTYCYIAILRFAASFSGARIAALGDQGAVTLDGQLRVLR